MHVADALISPPVALTGMGVAATLIGVASKKLNKSERSDLIPLMGIMGAFVFAAQMINFTIPGTGSSGHLIGGILLASILGPWAAFITLCSVLIVQCLIFADGGLLALGCNIVNMAATSCLLAWPLIYKPIAGNSLKPLRIATAAICSSIVALEIGALLVTIETEMSGITALPFSTFIQFMTAIHLPIGLVEGLVTAALIIFIAKYRPQILDQDLKPAETERKSLKPIYISFAVITLILAGGFTILASEYPDGLEWSVDKVTQGAEFVSSTPPTAFMPDYDSSLAGIVGAFIVMVLVWGVSSFIVKRINKNKVAVKEETFK